jgi:hypothetical protein
MTMPSSRDLGPKTKPILLNAETQQPISPAPTLRNRANGTRPLMNVSPRLAASQSSRPSPLFAGISQLVSVTYNVGGGEEIFGEGEDAQFVYKLVTGSVRVCTPRVHFIPYNNLYLVEVHTRTQRDIGAPKERPRQCYRRTIRLCRPRAEGALETMDSWSPAKAFRSHRKALIASRGSFPNSASTALISLSLGNGQDDLPTSHPHQSSRLD